MREECSAGIFIFTADEAFLKVSEDGTQEQVWRPRENVVYELGAASILYENRIVIFKERGVNFPSDFSDLGYIEFEKDQLATEIGFSSLSSSRSTSSRFAPKARLKRAGVRRRFLDSSLRGCRAGIRTPTKGSKDPCATVTPLGRVSSSRV